jgi:GTP-dependent phosphoenolpyruvate carboxykinase
MSRQRRFIWAFGRSRGRPGVKRQCQQLLYGAGTGMGVLRAERLLFGIDNLKDSDHVCDSENIVNYRVHAEQYELMMQTLRFLQCLEQYGNPGAIDVADR